MLGRLTAIAIVVVTVSAVATPVHAQWDYPFGFGFCGWHGWEATSVMGDEARGMGVFAVGAGEYNLNTAQAEAINHDTVMRFNEYIWQAQKLANRRYYQRQAQERKRVNESLAKTYARLR